MQGKEKVINFFLVFLLILVLFYFVYDSLDTLEIKYSILSFCLHKKHMTGQVLHRKKKLA